MFYAAILHYFSFENKKNIPQTTLLQVLKLLDVKYTVTAEKSLKNNVSFWQRVNLKFR